MKASSNLMECIFRFVLNHTGGNNMRDDIRNLYENDCEDIDEDSVDLKKKKKKKCKKYIKQNNKLLKKQNKYLKKLVGINKLHDVKKENKGGASKTSFLTKLGDACIKAVPAILTTCATTILTLFFKRKSDKRTLQAGCAMA